MEPEDTDVGAHPQAVHQRPPREVRPPPHLSDYAVDYFPMTDPHQTQLPQEDVFPADVQQLLVIKEEVPSEQQEWSPSLDQEGPEPLHIKEEQEDFWTSQEGDQIKGLEEADITNFPFTPVPVKSEDDEESPQSSQFHQRLTEQMETETDGEDCGGPEPARNSDPDRYPEPDTDDETGDFSEPETDDSDDWKDTREPQSGLNSLNNDEVHDSSCSADEKPFSCSVCGKGFGFKHHLKRHMQCHTGDKPFSCSVCKKTFTQSGYLLKHMRIHTGEKPFSCSICKKYFTQRISLQRHMRTHTGEKPFSCSVCKKSFTQSGNLQTHMGIHSRETPFSCSECRKRFGTKANLKMHMRTHTEEKPFSCTVCGKRFSRKNYIVSHMNIHTEKKQLGCSVHDATWSTSLKTHNYVDPQSLQLHQSVSEQIKTEADGEYSGGPDSLNINEVPVNDERYNSCKSPLSCSECGKRFGFKGHLKRHMRTHTGEKPFSCSVCEKSFAEHCSLQKHMRFHTGEKPFNCPICNKCFTQSGSVQRHMRTHTGEKPFSCSVCKKCFAESASLKKHMRIHSGETIQLLILCDQQQQHLT